MKKNFIKSVLFFFFSIIAFSVSAQNALVDSMTEIRDEWVRPLYPIILGIALLSGALVNIGKLQGENRDIKAFIMSLLIFLGVSLAIVGLYEAVTAIVV